jgi:hypothetical protein
VSDAQKNQRRITLIVRAVNITAAVLLFAFYCVLMGLILDNGFSQNALYVEMAELCTLILGSVCCVVFMVMFCVLRSLTAAFNDKFREQAKMLFWILAIFVTGICLEFAFNVVAY